MIFFVMFSRLKKKLRLNYALTSPNFAARRLRSEGVRALACWWGKDARVAETERQSGVFSEHFLVYFGLAEEVVFRFAQLIETFGVSSGHDVCAHVID